MFNSQEGGNVMGRVIVGIIVLVILLRLVSC